MLNNTIFNKKSGLLFVIFSCYLTLCLVSQVHAWPFGKNDQESLKARAEKYWDSKLTGDMITCYQLEEPTYRKKVPVSIYVRTGPLVYKDVKIKDVKISDDNGTVEVKIHYLIPAFGSRHIFNTEIKDKWKKINGKWFHVRHERREDTINNKVRNNPRRKEVMDGR